MLPQPDFILGQICQQLISRFQILFTHLSIQYKTFDNSKNFIHPIFLFFKLQKFLAKHPGFQKERLLQTAGPRCLSFAATVTRSPATFLSRLWCGASTTTCPCPSRPGPPQWPGCCPPPPSTAPSSLSRSPWTGNNSPC